MILSFTNKNKEKGFSIMEVTVSVAIVAFTFVGMMSLFTYNIRLEIQDRNRIIAAYLAQEAIEIVRQQRDNNWFAVVQRPTWDGITKSNPDVFTYLPDPDHIQSGWDIGYADSVNKRKIYLYNGNYVQVNNSSPSSSFKATPFTRSLLITDETDGFNLPSLPTATGDRIKVVVTVGYGTAQPLVVTSYLYNEWY
jgi:type II secretory pathway pseudopilin PulG